MLDTHLKEMRELEDHYWWFVARRKLALTLLDQERLETPRLLDCGCGAGALLAELDVRGEAHGIDESAAAIEITRDRGFVRLVRSDVGHAPFEDGAFDAVTMLDVLEHVEEDQAALDETARLLRPGGVLVTTLPALGILWGSHDEALGHLRRYGPRRLREMLADAGLELQKLSFGLCLLFPVALVLRWFQRTFRRKGAPPATGLVRVPKWLNRVLIWSMDVENAMIRKVNLPVGVSLVAVARKPVHEIEK